jgi:ABC transporter substrate binding protein
MTLLGGAAAAWPLAAGAQQPGKLHTIGLLNAASAPTTNALFDGLLELGWVEGKNISFERRYADNKLERLPELAAELVRRKVDLIVAFGTLAPLAARQATSTIPIVMAAAGDPVGSGLVASLARPGGNVTGMSLMSPDLAGKRLELLKEVVPGSRASPSSGMRPILILRPSSGKRKPRVAHLGLRFDHSKCVLRTTSMPRSRWLNDSRRTRCSPSVTR